MHVLLQFKSYNEYFDMLLEEKKSSEWNIAYKNLIENKDMEKCLKDRIRSGEDYGNINFFVKKLWSEYQKNVNINKIDNIYPIVLTAEILEILFRSHKNIELLKELGFLKVLIITFVKLIKNI